MSSPLSAPWTSAQERQLEEVVADVAAEDRVDHGGAPGERERHLVAATAGPSPSCRRGGPAVPRAMRTVSAMSSQRTTGTRSGMSSASKLIVPTPPGPPKPAPSKPGGRSAVAAETGPAAWSRHRRDVPGVDPEASPSRAAKPAERARAVRIGRRREAPGQPDVAAEEEATATKTTMNRTAWVPSRVKKTAS